MDLVGLNVWIWELWEHGFGSMEYMDLGVLNVWICDMLTGNAYRRMAMECQWVCDIMDCNYVKSIYIVMITEY